MNNLLIHPSTRRQLARILESPPHAILLAGKSGSGKTTVAQHLAAGLLGISVDKLSSHPYSTVIDPNAPNITIDEIRELQQFLKLRVPSSSKRPVQRVVTIVRAERMRSEAQNAILKTLEEPPAGTVVVLTADNPALLLPTISSRTQLISILPVDKDQAKEYFSDVDAAAFNRSYALSGGQAGLLHALLHDTDHPLVHEVNRAKTLLAQTPAERLLMVDELAKDKQAVQQLLDALLRVTHAGLYAASSKQAVKAVSAWHSRHQAVLGSIEYMRKNANTKLVLDNLFLNI